MASRKIRSSPDQLATIEAAPENDPPAHKPYATFTVELSLDEANQVRRIRTVHVQTGEEASLPGWQPEQLTALLARQAGVALAAPAQPEQAAAVGETQPAQPQARLQLSQVYARVAEGQPKLARSGQALTVRLHLNYDEPLPATPQVDYLATVFLHRIGGEHTQLGTAQGSLATTASMPIKVCGIAPEPGTYRLEATIRLSIPQPIGEAQIEGNLIEVL